MSAICAWLLASLPGCRHGELDPLPIANAAAVRPCGKSALFDAGLSSSAEQELVRRLRAASRLQNRIPVHWSSTREDPFRVPPETSLQLSLRPRYTDDVVCQMTRCDPDVGDDYECWSIPVHVELKSLQGVVARSLDAEIYIRPDSAIWLRHRLWQLDDPALRAALHVPEHEVLGEDLYLRVAGERATLQAIYETRIQVVLDAELLGTGQCDLSSLEPYEPLPPL